MYIYTHTYKYTYTNSLDENSPSKLTTLTPVVINYIIKIYCWAWTQILDLVMN